MGGNHTPGPWKKSSIMEGDGEFIEISDQEGRLIADVWVHHPDDSAEGRYMWEGIANAALIATAPELLLALKRAKDYIKHMGGSRGHIFDLPGKLEILDKVIAKAEGRGKGGGEGDDTT